VHPRRQPLSLGRGEQRVDQDGGRSPEISVEVLAGQVAEVLSSHPGPPDIGLYPLLKRQSTTN